MSFEKHIDKANSILQKWSWIYTGNKYDDAIEEIQKAINICRLEKNVAKAAELYVWCAELDIKNNALDDAVSKYESAAKCYQAVDDSKNAIVHFFNVIKFGQDNLSKTARAWENIAGLQEETPKLYSKQECIVSWKTAEKYFHAATDSIRADHCRNKIARLHIDLEEYKDAIGNFLSVAQSASNGSSTLSKYRSNDPLYFAGLCKLKMESENGSMETYSEFLESLIDIYPAFETCREYKFLLQLSDAFEKDDLQKFNDIIFKYDESKKLTDFEAKLLVSVKDILENGVSKNETIDLS